MWERSGRRALAWAAFAALLFYIIPVTAVQSLLALNSVTGWLASVPVRTCTWNVAAQASCAAAVRPGSPALAAALRGSHLLPVSQLN